MNVETLYNSLVESHKEGKTPRDNLENLLDENEIGYKHIIEYSIDGLDFSTHRYDLEDEASDLLLDVEGDNLGDWELRLE
jgi:hypothetical protein